MTTWGIVPCRKGSTRLPGKNFKNFMGKPLFHHAVDAALAVKEIDHVILTTNDPIVMELSKKYLNLRRFTLIKRADSLALSSTPSYLVALDAMERVGAGDDDILIYLQPTSPLRTADDVRTAYYVFIMSVAYSLISCTKHEKGALSFRLQDGYLEPFNSKFHSLVLKPSQKYPEVLVPNGAIYIIRYKHLKTYRNFYTPMTKAYMMDKERSVDIDDFLDLVQAKIYAKALKKLRRRLKQDA